MNLLVGLPAWVVVLVSGAVCALLAVGFRALLKRHLGDDQVSAASVAGPLMPALGAVFALLTATTLAAEAGQYRSAEDNVSAEAAAASRLAWASTSPGLDSKAIQDDLASYLTSTREREWEGGDRDGDERTMQALGDLERTVRSEAAGKDVGSAQGGELLGVLDSLTSLRRQRLATAANDLPELYLLVVLMSGLALVANSAALAITHRARLAALTAGLVIVVALAMSLLVAISAPFRGGFIVEGGPIDAVRTSIDHGDFQPWSLLLAIAVVAGCVLVAVCSILLVRRHAPDGSYFHDGDRASGVFGVLATGFAVLLGLVVVLAFTSFDESRSGAETEALLVSQQYETAQFLPKEQRGELSGELVCYARSVVHQEWPRMDDGTEGDAINPWAVELFETIRKVDPQTPSQQAAYGKWLDQTSDREAARNDRMHGAVGVIPTALWLVLLFSAVVIFGYMLLFADSNEPWFVQAALIGSVTAVVVASLLLINVLDNPFTTSGGGLKPVAMQRTLRVLAEEQVIAGGGSVPCDAKGLPAS